MAADDSACERESVYTRHRGWWRWAPAKTMTQPPKVPELTVAKLTAHAAYDEQKRVADMEAAQWNNRKHSVNQRSSLLQQLKAAETALSNAEARAE